MTKRHLWMTALLALAALVVAGGCGPQQTVPRDPADVPGYLKPPPDLAGVDPSALQGRRILIDPGHGGSFRGAVGDDGLSEAEVNLGVALYLQGLLQWAGAEVFLTRTADVDFLSPADSTLTADLTARVALCDSLRPDVFVSIHHNSTAQRDPDINETQTYYPLGREGADLDLARAIHRHLVLALEIEPAKILPGGFHVLRNSPVPAVLGEPAMISNPVMAGRLSLARSLEVEASAYFLGLLEYFAGGTPQWISDLPDTVEVTRNSPPLTWTFAAGTAGDPGLDPASLGVWIDGRPAPFDLASDGRTVTVIPPDVGTVTVELRGRNLAGRAADTRRLVVRPAAFEHCHWWIAAERDTTHPDCAEYGDSGFLLIYEAPGLDLRDFRRDLVAELKGGGSIELPRYPGERGWAMIDRRDIVEMGWISVIMGYAADPEDPSGFRLVGFADLAADLGGSYGVPGMAFLFLACPQETWPGRNVPGAGWRSRLGLPAWSASYFRSSARVRRPKLDRRSPVVPVDQGDTVWLEAGGALPLVATGVAPRDTLTWQPLLPALIGKRIALDPRGGGTDDQGLGPLGARGSDLNLRVAERLAALLRGAGCEVALVREAEIFTPDPERVRRADAHGADLYLAIGRGETPGVRHHHGSTVGEPWARSCAGAIQSIVPDTITVAAAWDYVLRHTACPAIMVELEAPSTVEIESRLADPAWQDAVARALFRGTVAVLQPDASFASVPDLLAALGDRAIPRDRLDLVRLDGNLSWLPPSGQVGVSPLPSWGAADPGLPVLGERHVLELRAGPHWQLWALDRLPGGDWHGRVLLENR